MLLKVEFSKVVNIFLLNYQLTAFSLVQAKYMFVSGKGYHNMVFHMKCIHAREQNCSENCNGIGSHNKVCVDRRVLVM